MRDLKIYIYLDENQLAWIQHPSGSGLTSTFE